MKKIACLSLLHIYSVILCGCILDLKSPTDSRVKKYEKLIKKITVLQKRIIVALKQDESDSKLRKLFKQQKILTRKRKSLKIKKSEKELVNDKIQHEYTLSYQVMFMQPRYQKIIRHKDPVFKADDVIY